jgi:putative spermidine/putrescine transport system permease protein
VIGAVVTPLRRWWLYGLVALILAYLVLPILVVIPASFSPSQLLEFPPSRISLRWYESYLQSPGWMNSTRASLEAAVLTMVVSTVFGVAGACAVNMLGRKGSRAAIALVLLPMLVPTILVAIGIFYVYIWLGLVNTMFGIVVAHSLLAVPFVVITVLSGLQSVDPHLEAAARSLGAPRLSAFWRVTLPQIRPSVISGALFAFVISLDEVVIGLFVAGGDNMVLTRRMFVSLRDNLDPTIAALSTLFILASLGALTPIALLGRRTDKRD